MKRTTRVDVTARADADALWAIIAEGDGHDRWMPNVVDRCVMIGEGVGALRVMEFTDGMVLEDRIIEMDHARRRYAHEILRHPFHATNGVVSACIEELDAARVRITWQCSFEAPEEHVAHIDRMLRTFLSATIQALCAYCGAEMEL